MLYIRFSFIVSLFELRIKATWKLISISFLSLFAYSLFILGRLNIDFFNFWGFGLMPSSIHSLKLICIYPFFLISARYLFEQKYHLFLIYLLIAVLIYNTLFVTVLGGLICGIFYLFITRKKHAIAYKSLFVLYLLFIVSLVLYSTIFASTHGENDYEVVHINSLKLFIILFIEYLLKNSIGYLLCFLFYGVVFVKNWRNKTLVFFTVVYFSAFFGSICIVSFFHGTENFPQMINNFVGPFCLLLFSVAFLFIKNSIKSWVMLFSVIGVLNFVYIVYENHKEVTSRKQFSTQYVDFVKHKMKPHDKFVIYNPANNYWFNYDVAEFTSRFIENGSGFNIHIKKQYAYKTKSPFEQWIFKNNKPLNYPNFIEYKTINHIKFLFTTSNITLPEDISENIILLKTDDSSKEKFYKFK